jgi:hypothetical protein
MTTGAGDPGPESTAERHKALVRRLIDIVNAGDLGALPEVATGRIARDAERWIGPFRASFPDFRMEVVDVIAEGDKVVGPSAARAPTAGSGAAARPPAAASRAWTRSTSSASRTAGWRPCSRSLRTT